jgi:diaminopimelate epimerase
MYFEKWQALGNDFVLVFDAPAGLNWSELAQRWCDRHTGIGADGVFLVTTGAHPAMVVYNADGSQSEMCGNGIRCVAGALQARAVRTHGPVLLQTGAGLRLCMVQATADGYDVSVDMGVPSFVPEDAGFTDTLMPLASVPTPIGGGHIASIGNPHWVFFEPTDPVNVTEWGPRLETDVRFLRRTNVEFVRQVGPRAFDVVVWERGVGLTQACGSGAVCVTALAVATGRTEAQAPVTIRLPGGALQCEVLASGQVRMTGPARRVFAGTIDG